MGGGDAVIEVSAGTVEVASEGNWRRLAPSGEAS
jgi:hypothetical protein